METRTVSKIPAIVLSCQGAPEGDLNVVRSLGECGVPVIVVSEYADPPAAASRYCSNFVYVPHYSETPEDLFETLKHLSHQHGTAPVIFPSADPDMAALNQMQDRLKELVRCTLAPSSLISELTDKRLFDALAQRLQLPVPITYTPSTLAEVDIVAQTAIFPLIIKPSHSVAWKHTEIPIDISRAKAILIQTPEELINVCRILEPYGLAVLIQEYVPGGDEEHYDVHAYINRKGQVQAIYSGRKWRIYPPHAGSGCFVESVKIPELEDLAINILQKVGYQGIANINFKRHNITGEFKLLEINPRVSQWNILATRSGVNLPWIAYRDACGLPPEPLPVRRTGVFYLNGKNDFRAFQQYHRMGELTIASYLGSLIKMGVVYQALSLSDPGPSFHLSRRWLQTKLRSLKM
jgi:predicted ATP-grasp superfamily ATP-dependent carboligase